MAHTPGPWPEPQYDNHGNGGFAEWWEVGGIAQVHTSEDDARLIAASPDMLEALEVVKPLMIPGMNWTDETGELVKRMVRAVIAKATGEGSVMATEDELALVRAAQKALQEFNSCLLALARHGIRVELTLVGDRHYNAEFTRTERFGS